MFIKMDIKISELNITELNSTKWDHYFMNLAKLTATMSKDPSTKVGASIRSPDKSVLSVGYNGFPSDISDEPDLLNNRELKYKYIIHAERNAIKYALRHGICEGCTIYTTMIPCIECYLLIRKNNIKKIITLKPNEDQLNRYYEQWTNVVNMAKMDNCLFYFI